MASPPRVYKIHHQHLSNNHKFEIDSDNGEKLYIAHLTPHLLCGQLFLREVSTDKELISICEESHHLHVSYNIASVNADQSVDRHLGTVKRIHGEHHFLKTFEINSTYGVYKVERVGGVFGHETKVTTGNKTVADVTKHVDFSEFANVYRVEISDDDGGDLFLLALVIALWRAQQWHHI
jgi:uncharacterized protein YxjI